MKKALWTLTVDGYAPEITALTHPLLVHYASKIGAEFRVIKERRFPGYPPQYEKLQIYELGRDYDWNIYVDSDALVHPDMFDPTDHLPKDTVCHNGSDMAGFRWTYDRFFRRDGRHIGSCNWFTAASDWCIDLWEPLRDLTLQQALDNITPLIYEQAPSLWRCEACKLERPTWDEATAENCGNCGKPGIAIPKRAIRAEDLLDDYTLSRNIAKYGLKFSTVAQIQERLRVGGCLWHVYTSSAEEKVRQMKQVLHGWGLDNLMLYEYAGEIGDPATS